jgi:hypothetical protein
VNSTVTLLFESTVPIASGDVIEMIWSGGTTLTVKMNTATIWTGTVTQHATRTLAGVGTTPASHEAL